MTNLVLTFIDILATFIGQQEAFIAFTFSRITNLSRSTVFLFVAARLTSAVYTNLTLETILV